MRDGYYTIGLGMFVLSLSIWCLRTAYLKDEIHFADTGLIIARSRSPFGFWLGVAIWLAFAAIGIVIMLSGSNSLREIS